MDWIRTEDISALPRENSWYWVTVENSFGRREVMEAEYKNGNWYDYNHFEMDVMAWYPEAKPKAYESEEIETQPEIDKTRDGFSGYLNDYVVGLEEKKSMVSSAAYKEWLYGYTIERKTFFDNELVYEKENTNREWSMLLSSFFSYIEELGVSTYYDEKGFEHYIIKLKDTYFDIHNIYGQGTVTHICTCDKNEKAYVLL